MTARSALIMLMVVGALLSGIGVAQAASVLSDRTDASAAQYGSTAPRSSVGAQTGTGERKGTMVTSAAGGSPTTPVATAQPSQQVPTGSTSSLPFTGYAAMSLVLAGLALLLGGVVLRRLTTRSARDD